MKLLFRLRFGFSHLRKHKFRYNFKESLIALRSCSTCSIEAEFTSRFLLHCHFMNYFRATLLNNLRNIENGLFSLSVYDLTNLLLHNNLEDDDKANKIILLHTIKYRRVSQRFNESLFN